MIVSASIGRWIVSAAVIASGQFSYLPVSHQLTTSNGAGLRGQEQSQYSKLPACPSKKGKKYVRAKSPDVLGEKASKKSLQCFAKADVDAGKKVLNGTKLACFACHSLSSEWSPSTMISNLRSQGDGTLSQSNITNINNEHLSEMLSSVATAKQLKQVRAYLKCGFKG